jgi:hypothetical protein
MRLCPKLTFAFLLVFVLSCVGFTQTASSFAISQFSIDASAISFSGAGGTSAATIAGARIAITDRVSLGEQTIILPDLSANYILGTADYTMPLNNILGKSLSSKLKFDARAWLVTLGAGAGIVKQTLEGTTHQRIAVTVPLFLSYRANDKVSFRVVGIQWVNGGVAGAGPNRIFANPTTNNLTASTGLSLTF